MDAVYTQADQIAAVSRFATCSQFTLGRPVGSIQDVDASGSEHFVLVDQHQWGHLPARAKTFGARFLIGRGWHSKGRAHGDVVAADGSVCTVVLE